MKMWLLIFMFVSSRAVAQAYEVLPHEGPTRGLLWLSEGPTLVTGENRSMGHRFRLGGELQLGADHRFILGWTFFDIIAAHEKSASVGDVSREGSGPVVGYFLVPDEMWVSYMFSLSSVRGSRVSGGGLSVYGHQFSVGHRFYTSRSINLSGDLSYLYVPRTAVPVFDVNTGGPESAEYPSASVWTLALRLGFDLY
jgi:hypothetical protein